MHKLPTLYKDAQEWTIWSDGNSIYTKWGKVGGKLQTSAPTLCEGKNIGKSNETTPEQQAALEATSEWNKKKKKGYHKKNSSSFSWTFPNPMLAHNYDDHKKKIKFPAICQPKLDGHRCAAVLLDGKCTLYSRNGTIIKSVPHINKAISDIADYGLFIYDGELYNHEYKSNFEDLTSFIRQEEPKDGCEVVLYNLYDVMNDEIYYPNRHDSVKSFVEKDKSGFLVHVESIIVNNEKEMKEAHDGFVSRGYEGTIIRNFEGKYVNKRSYDLQKYKNFVDGEFEITDVRPGKGKLSNCGIFVCKTLSGMVFDAKLVGKLKDLEKFLTNKDDYIGKFLTVKYQGLTSGGNLRFPVGLRIRNDV